MKSGILVLCFAFASVSLSSCTGAQAKQPPAKNVYTKYILIEGGSIYNLQDLVQERITNGGYTPIGGVCASGGTFYQALVR